MPEDLSDVFADIAQQGEQATGVPGAQAARARARQLTVRRRLVASTAAVALIAAAGGIAVVTAVQGRGSSTPLQSTAQSGTPTPGRAASPSASRPTAGASTSPSGTTPASSSSAQASVSVSTSTGGPASPQPSWSWIATPTPIPAAWLTPAQLPDDSDLAWTAPGSAADYPDSLDAKVADCGTVDQGFSAWEMRAYVGTGVKQAIQQTFLYPSPSLAQQAYTDLAQLSGCQAAYRNVQSANGVTPDAVVTQPTATVTDGVSWTVSWSGEELNGVGPPETEFFYYVWNGDAVSALQIAMPGPNATAPSAATSPSVLNAMIQDLGAYGGGG